MDSQRHRTRVVQICPHFLKFAEDFTVPSICGFENPKLCWKSCYLPCLVPARTTTCAPRRRCWWRCWTGWEACRGGKVTSSYELLAVVPSRTTSGAPGRRCYCSSALTRVTCREVGLIYITSQLLAVKRSD